MASVAVSLCWWSYRSSLSSRSRASGLTKCWFSVCTNCSQRFLLCLQANDNKHVSIFSKPHLRMHLKNKNFHAPGVLFYHYDTFWLYSVFISTLHSTWFDKSYCTSWNQRHASDLVQIIKNRSCSVHVGDSSSTTAPFTYGVPQGCILGPLLFSLYMLPLSLTFRKHNFSFHRFANNIQAFILIQLTSRCMGASVQLS